MGHDERFAEAATIFKGKQGLQTPEDFLHALTQDIHPPGGRRLVFTKLDACYDWQPFFEPLASKVTGIGASFWKRDRCYSKQYILRADLARDWLVLLKRAEVEVPDVFAKVPVDPPDVIMLCKDFCSDQLLSQAPLLFLPKVVAEKLAPGGPRQTAERTHLSEEQLKQFRRTAAKAAEPPGNWVRAQGYLNQWCQQNENRAWPEPVKLSFVLDGKTTRERRQLDPSDNWRITYASEIRPR